jgi:major cell surface glycoprotein (TIGR04216 family)
VAFLNVDYNFDEADKLSITVEDDDLEVTDQIVDDGFITESDTDEELDFSDVDAGQYTITVEGDDFGPSQTVTVNVSDEDVAVSLDETEVTKGERVVATIDGTPGTQAHIRIDSGDLDEDELEAELGEDSDFFDNNPVDTNRVAQEVFSATGDVEVRGGSENTDDSGENVVFAVGDLGDDGSVPIQINSQFIESGTITVEAAEGTDFTADADDSVDLTVEERAISIDSAPSNVAIGEEFTVNGTADEADEVRAYARIDQSWVPLEDENGNLAADTNVDDDGTFEIDIDSGSVINLPDNYRIGFVADPAYPSNVDANDELSQETWGDFDTTESITVTTQEGSLSAELSSSTVATQTGDEITLSGSAIGQEQVDVYAIGPRGEIELRERINADEDNAFEEDYSFFDRRGSYTFIVVGEGRDGNFGSDVSDEPLDPEDGLTQEQAVEIIREAYEDAGSDNPIVELTLLSENPSLTLDIEDGAEVPQDEVTLSGTSNREDGTVVFIEVLDENDDAVFSTEAEVNGSSSSWSVEADMSDVETGDYTLRVEDDETSATTQISVVEEVSEDTPTPEPDTETPTPEPDTETPTPEPDTETPTPEPDTETTTTTTPGFGAVVAVLALLGAALLALRRD